jgi:hypothetical protein
MLTRTSFVMQDKDGVAAAAVFAEMAGSHYRRGTTVAAHLRELYNRWGAGRDLLFCYGRRW